MEVLEMKNIVIEIKNASFTSSFDTVKGKKISKYWKVSQQKVPKLKHTEKQKKVQENNQRIQELRSSIKLPNTNVIRIPKEEDTENKAQKTYEEVMIKNF